MYRIFCVKQKTAYELRISDWSSDVCSSDLRRQAAASSDDARFQCRQGAAAVVRHRRGRCGGVPAEFRFRQYQRDRRVRRDGAGRIRRPDRKSVGKGKSVSGRVVLGGVRIIIKKITQNRQYDKKLRPK